MQTFRAMSTDVTVAAPELAAADERTLADAIEALFADTERRFSRFRIDSELSCLNRATTLTVSGELAELLAAARSHVDATGGVFDPTIGGALVAAGYDRSFAPGALDRDASCTAHPTSFADVVVDGCTVTKPAHVQLDLGGFLKGRTVDRAAALAPSPSIVDAGGDLVIHGEALVDIEDPADARNTLATLHVRDRAVATSAPNRRRWRAGDATAHHLIDPRSGAPARSDLAQVTVVAATAEHADVLAKTVFVLGRDAGARFLASRAAGVLVGIDGTLNVVGDLEGIDA